MLGTLISCEPAQNSTSSTSDSARADSLQKELDKLNKSDATVLGYIDSNHFPQVGMYVNNSDFTSEEIKLIKTLAASQEGKLGSNSYGEVGDAVALPLFVRLMSVSKELRELNGKVASCGTYTHADSLRFAEDVLIANPVFAKEMLSKLNKKTGGKWKSSA